MIIAKIDAKEDGKCDAEMTVRGDFKTLVTEYTMIGVNLAEAFAKKDPNMAKAFENMMRQACEDGLLTDPENAAKKKEKEVENAEKGELTLKDALDKLKDMLEELEK